MEENLPLLLVAQRDPFVVELLQRVLSSHYRLEFVGNGAQALERARQVQPDLIITAILLPGMDGLQLCRQLKNDPQTAHIPVLFATFLLAREQVEEAGGDGFVLMPLRTEALLAEIEALLKRPPSPPDVQEDDENEKSPARK